MNENHMQTFGKMNIILFVLIISAGVFLRTYHHSDLLRFNPDQARDAALVREVLNGNESWPSLGPVAGGTDFKLGPVFYHAQILAGKLFGSDPKNLAYPDLFFSIATIFILYLFLRQLFGRKVSLAAISVFAVSFYSIKYARFAWNPNSAPFFSLLFLFSTFKLAYAEKKHWIWAMLSGLAIGIGVQLHSLLLFSLPIVLVIYLAYLFWKKNKAWRWAPLIILVALIFNSAQIMNEFRTGGGNFQAFAQGLEKKSGREGSLPYKFVLDGVCHIQAGSFMLLPIGNNDRCDFMDAAKDYPKNKLLPLHIAFASIFFLGGLVLLARRYLREKEDGKRGLLFLILSYVGVLFVLLIPLAAEISFRFFLVLEFLPFVFLGLWIEFLSEKFPRGKVFMATTLVAAAVAVNFVVVARQFSYLSGRSSQSKNGFEEITLGEARFMADFILARSGAADKVFLDGKAGEVAKVKKPIEYFTSNKGVGIDVLDKNDVLSENDKLFFIDVVANPTETSSSGSYGRARIFERR